MDRWEARFPREARFLRAATDDSPKKPKIVDLGAYAGENQKGELLMNIRILLLLPLLLGVSVNGWTAPAKCDGADNLPGCKGDNVDSEPTFSIHMQAGNGVLDAKVCDGVREGGVGERVGRQANGKD